MSIQNLNAAKEEIHENRQRGWQACQDYLISHSWNEARTLMNNLFPVDVVDYTLADYGYWSGWINYLVAHQ